MKHVLLYYSNGTKPASLRKPILERFKTRANYRGWPIVSVGDKRVAGIEKHIKFVSDGLPMEESIFGKLVVGLSWIKRNIGEDVRVFLCDDDVIHPDRHYLQCPDVEALAYNLNFVYASKIGVFETCNRASLTNGGLSGPVNVLLDACQSKLANFDGCWEPTQGATNYRSDVPCIDLRGPWNNTWKCDVVDGQPIATNQPAAWTNERNPLVDWALEVVNGVKC